MLVRTMLASVAALALTMATPAMAGGWGAGAPNVAQQVVYKEFPDPRTGMVQTRMPLPADWQVVPDAEGQNTVQSRSGVAISAPYVATYHYTPDPQMQGYLQQAGHAVAPPMALGAFFEAQFLPHVAQQGYRLTRAYALPGVRARQEALARQRASTGGQRSVDAMGSEWVGPNGERSFAVLVLQATAKPNYVVWQVSITELEAPPAGFDAARDAYVRGLENIEANPAFIAYMNQQLMQNAQANDAYAASQMAQSQRLHQQRMNDIAAAGAAARANGQTYRQILDQSHQGYMDRSRMSDAGQAYAVDGIREETVIAGANGGQAYVAPAGAGNYWVNRNGEYIATEDANFDPRVRQDLNQQGWERYAPTGR